jgi:hypothetical protein
VWAGDTVCNWETTELYSDKKCDYRKQTHQVVDNLYSVKTIITSVTKESPKEI